MNILVCGSSGCIGRAVVHSLRARGHRVLETRRDSGSPARIFASARSLDFMVETLPSRWTQALKDDAVEAIVNCAGVLIESPRARFARVHTEGPSELFRGAAVAGVRRIVQVSALGVGGASRPGSEPEYLRSKRLADEALLALPIDAAVVRPSLVYGRGSQSARLFATLASLPLVSLPGAGRQRLQPIHVFELAECIVRLVERPDPVRGVYELGGAAAVGYREMLASYRAALGLGEPLWLPLPMWSMRLGALVAELVPQRVFSRDTLRLLEFGNTTTANAAATLLGRAPATLAEGLAVTAPKPALDLRVAMGAPIEWLLRGALAFLWLQTALVSALLPRESGVLDLLARCGLPGLAGTVALACSCLLNAGLGLGTLVRPSARLFALQAAAVIGYTATAAWHVPALTIDHCGPLAKNVPLLACVVLLWLACASKPGPAEPDGRPRQRALTRRYWRPEARCPR